MAPSRALQRGEAQARGPSAGHLFFNADGATERPADFAPSEQTVYGMGRRAGMEFAPEVAQQIQNGPYFWGGVTSRGGNPYAGGFAYSNAGQPAGMQPEGTQPEGTQPAGIGANRLMTAPQQWGERRDPVMPLQGYQNALLRGF